MKRNFALSLSVVLLLFIFFTALPCYAESPKYGYIDKEGNMVIQAKYDFAYNFFNGFARVFLGSLSSEGTPESGKYGFINTSGETISDIQWENAHDFDFGRAAVKKNNKYGVIDTKGKIVVEPKYDFISYFQEGYAFVFNGTLLNWGYPDIGKYGFIDTNGNMICDMVWDRAESFHEGLASVNKNGKAGCIDTTGKTVIKPQYDYVGPFWNGCAVVFNGTLDPSGEPDAGQYGFVDKTGKIISSIHWEDAYQFQEGFAAVKEDGKWGFIDQKGNITVEPKYDYIYPFTEGRARAFIGTTGSFGWPVDGTYCFIDTTGKLVGSLAWDYVGFYSEGLAEIGIGGKAGFINQQGDLVIAPEYDYVYRFTNGYAVVYQGSLTDRETPDVGAYGVIDKTGKLIGSVQWDAISPFSDGMARVKTNGYYGYIDESGSLAIDAQYESAESFSEGLAAVVLSEAIGDFRKTSWGMTRQEVEALEGDPYTTGTVEALKNVEYIAYKTTFIGLDALLAYYFSPDGLYGTRYILQEPHNNGDLYIEDYKKIQDALTEKYGSPYVDEENWDNTTHKNYYADDKGDALSLGYLAYETTYATLKTCIFLSMDADKTFIDYCSVFIGYPEED